MGKYTVEVEADKRYRSRCITVKPAGLIRGLRGRYRNYPDNASFAADLARYLSYTTRRIELLEHAETLVFRHEDMELSDLDAAYFGWCAEDTKRVYIFLKVLPIYRTDDGRDYLVEAQTKLEEPLTEPIPFSADRLLLFLKSVNCISANHFLWEMKIKDAVGFNVITVPHLWAEACSEHGIDLAHFTVISLPAPEPILALAAAVRSDLFTPKLSLEYPERYRYKCTHCNVTYELVVIRTEQGSFVGLPDPSVIHFELLRRSIDEGHPAHTAVRTHSMGTNVFPAHVFVPKG